MFWSVRVRAINIVNIKVLSLLVSVKCGCLNCVTLNVSRIYICLCDSMSHNMTESCIGEI